MSLQQWANNGWLRPHRSSPEEIQDLLAIVRRDLADAEAFYHAALGFDKVVWNYPGALFMSAGGYHHHLGTNTWASGAPPASDADARLLEWEIVVPTKKNAEEAARHVKSAGYPVREENGEWILTDPWGTSLRLVPER